MADKLDREMVTRGIIGDDDERIRLYHYDATFHAQIDTLVMFTEEIVQGFEAKAREQGAARRALMDAEFRPATRFMKRL
jgi:hypothetical protein